MSQHDWTPCLNLLQALTSQITEIQSVLQNASRAEQADELVGLCSQLAQNMSQALPVLQQQLNRKPPPADVLAQLQHMQTGLNDLRTQVTVQGSAVARALKVLFPTQTAHNGYGALGGRGLGGGRLGSHGYLKA
jgi:hypothetical protein